MARVESCSRLIGRKLVADTEDRLHKLNSKLNAIIYGFIDVLVTIESAGVDSDIRQIVCLDVPPLILFFAS